MIRTDHLMSADFTGSKSPARRRWVRARPINTELAVRVVPAEELEGAAQIAPAMPLECSRNLALPFNAQQPVHVHRFTCLDGGGQMPVNRAFGEAAQPGDFFNRPALPKEMQRFHHGFR